MLVWYNHLPSLLPETSDRWRVGCFTTWGSYSILAGNYIIRDSSVFTYDESIFHNMWTVLVKIIFCISCSQGLPGIWSIKLCMPFLIMPRAPVTTGIALILSFHIFVTSICKIFLFRKLLELFERNIVSCWNCNIYHDACILFEIFYCNVWLVWSYLSICTDSEVP